ncbi:MAG: MotA/TolQ/ExbB proton channel family protein [Phycisphaerae bacterium]|nr:MotA/TolQ/ExbB proton channel family protein [Phycisphaerae bacterium]
MTTSPVFAVLTQAWTLAQAPPAAPAGPAGRSLLQYIHGGGYIGYVIILLSIVAVALALVNLIRLRLERLAPPESVESLRRLVRENQVARAGEFCRSEENESFLTRVFGAALARCQRSPFGMLEIRSALEESGRTELDRLQRANDVIGLIAAVAPMLGLLGTVVGMVGAFETIADTEGAAKPYQLAGSISLALITTVQGLVVAIPCTAVQSHFRGRVERLAGEVAQVTEDLALTLESGGEGKPARPAPRAEPAREVGAR